MRSVDDFFFLTGSSVVPDFSSSVLLVDSVESVDSVDSVDSVASFVAVLSAVVALPEPVELDSDVADVVSDSVGVAHATPAGVAIAVPMPKATARAPTRPMYLLYPAPVYAMATTPSSLFVTTVGRYPGSSVC